MCFSSSGCVGASWVLSNFPSASVEAIEMYAFFKPSLGLKETKMMQEKCLAEIS